MKKIINIFITRRNEINNKWWNRLFNVLLLGSTIVIFVLSLSVIGITYDNSWVTYSVKFSFEPDYNDATGTEIDCKNSLGFLECEGVDSALYQKQYSDLYDKSVISLQKQFGIDKYDYDNCPHTAYQKPINVLFDKISGKNTTADYPPQLIDCVNKLNSDMKADPSYSQYTDSIKTLGTKTSIRLTKIIHYPIIIIDVALWIFIPLIAVLIWIVFWSSIIYRSILYIIFGKNKLK